jgi:O-antigen ligase
VSEPANYTNNKSRTRRRVQLTSLVSVLLIGLLVPLVFAPWREEVFAPVKVQVIQLLTGIGLMAVGTQLLLIRDGRRLRPDPRADAVTAVASTPVAPCPSVGHPIGVDLMAMTFGVINVIACANSLDPAGSWWGRFPEYQGLLTTIAYLMTYALARLAFLPARPGGSPASLDALFGVLTATTGLLGGYAILQRAGLDPLWGFTERPFATLGHANNLAAMLVVGLPGCVAICATHRGPVRVAAALAGVLGSTGLAMSLSRGGWFAALVTAALGLALSPARTRRRALAGTAALLVALSLTLAVVPVGRGLLAQAGSRVAALGQTDTGSTGKHLALARIGVGVTLEHPWLGIGQDSFPLVAQPYADRQLPPPQARLLASRTSESPHNTLLSVSTNTGVPGLLVYVGFLGAVARRMVAARRAGHQQAVPVLMILVAYFASSLFMTPEVSSTAWLWLTAGAACSAVRPPRPRSPAPSVGTRGVTLPTITCGSQLKVPADVAPVNELEYHPHAKQP